MKRDITLYIAGRRADLEDETLVVFNYAADDLENPTIAKNTWSNDVTLPRTPDNDKLLGDAFRLDRVVGSGVTQFGADFNPRRRTPFVIYSSAGEALVDGYAKLTAVTAAGYKLTLYGGLGSLLYGLSYDENGDALTLASLDYLQTGNPAAELDFIMSRTAILTAWQDLTGGTSQMPAFGVVNFAPCYNGIPTEDFDADRCVFDGTALGLAGTLTASLSRKYTEREMKDYRSYLQRPVVKVSAVLGAIVRAASDLGYTLTLPTISGDTWLEDTWMTLPLLKGKRSGDTVTKADLLGGTCSPAQFLLGLVKTLGLRILNTGPGEVAILSRDDFYTGATEDLTGRVAVDRDPELIPLLMDAKWYEFSADDEGEFAKTYKEKYGRTYGSQRVNTGYEFDAAVKQLGEDIPFKGAAMIRESSGAYRDALCHFSGSPGEVVPAAFLDGGTYQFGDTTRQLGDENYSATWWDQANPGRDTADFPQLHGEDNKALDGSGVLLFFDGTALAAPADAVLTDDIAAMGETPCWNWLGVASSPLLGNILPHFTRWLVDNTDTIVQSLDWGVPQEIGVPGVTFHGDDTSVYGFRWADFLRDRYDENTKVLRCRVDFAGLQVGPQLLRRFWWWRGCIWVLSKISNYSLTTFDPAECEFVQVRDMNAYTNGQN